MRGTSDNVYLIKTDENGDTLGQNFGDINDDCGFSVLQTNDNDTLLLVVIEYLLILYICIYKNRYKW